MNPILTGIIIQARMGSTRLPGKVLKSVCGKPLLYYSVARSALSKYANIVIVATTNSEKDDQIVHWCKKNGIAFFRGSEEDVLDRYYQAAKKFNLNTVVRVTSDCPFVDPRIVDMLILILQNQGLDYVSNRIDKRTWPHGLDVEAVTFETLEKAWRHATSQDEREHVTPYIMRHPELFKILEVPYTEKDLSRIRLTVDYAEDLEFTTMLMEEMMKEWGIDFSWKNVVKALKRKPELSDINRHRIDPVTRDLMNNSEND